jgi:predicted acetyltransferase
VGTFRSFPQRVTAVGGQAVRANAISSVSVASTHRRRGILRRMMGADLAAAHERGDAVATLRASEYGIYGRFGFAPASHAVERTIDLARTGLDRHAPLPLGGGRIDAVDAATVLAEGPSLHARFLPTRAGAIDRDTRWWHGLTGTGYRAPDWKEPVHVRYAGPDGTTEGLLTYVATHTPRTATVRDLTATSPAAERALWTYLCTIDHVHHVETGERAPDDLLPLLLPDPRAAEQAREKDGLWVRVLDVPAAFEARTYEAAGSLALGVTDAEGPAGGTYRLTAEADGKGLVERTGEEPELALDVRELARLWLGDASPLALVAAGLAEERTEGAAARAERLLRTARRPWCPDGF